jgi:L-ribulose-5-phosphate 3-epimerase
MDKGGYMNRRTFMLNSIAGTAGLAGFPTIARSFIDPPVMAGSVRVLKALKIGMVSEGESILEKFEIIRASGFDGVELDSPAEFVLDEVLNASEKTGIKVPGVVLSTHWNKPFNHPDPTVRKAAKAALKHALNDCKALGGTSVLVVPAVVNESMSYRDAYRISQQEIGELVPMAEDLGVSIAFENVWNKFLLSPLEAARYVDEFKSKHVGWHFDIGNIVNFGYPAQWIDTLGHRIFKLDVKGFSRQKRNDEGLWKGFSVEIGDGDADWPAVNLALDRIGYRGWAAAEVSGGGLERLTEVARRMDKVFGLTDS